MLHHVRTLVDTGFLIEQPPRRGPRGSRERPYLASGKSWYVDTGEVSWTAAEDLLLQTFLQEVAAVPPGALNSYRLGFQVSAEDRRRLVGRFEELLEEIARLPSDPDGEPWSLYLGLHPDVGGVRPVSGAAARLRRTSTGGRRAACRGRAARSVVRREG